MTLLTEDALRKFIDASATRASVQAVCDEVGIKIGTYFGWLARSKLDQKNNAYKANSLFWISVDPFGFMWFHDHVRRSKQFFKLGLEGLALDLCAGFATELCYGPQDGLPIQERNPLYRHRSDEWLIEHGLDPAIDRFEWLRDPLTDDILGPKFQRKESKPASQVLIAALRAMLPASWSEKTEITHAHTGHVIHKIEPAKFVSRNTPQNADVVDADFTDAPQLTAPIDDRDDIAELRAAAALLMQNGPKNPRPVGSAANLGAPRDDGSTRPSSEFGGGPLPTREPRPVSENPRAYQAREPRPPDPPSYARRSSVDAERTSPKGGNLNRVVK